MSLKPHTTRDGRTVWTADFRDQHGVRRRVRIDKPDRDARAEYDRIMRQVDAGAYVHHAPQTGTLGDYIDNVFLAAPGASRYQRETAKSIVRILGDVPVYRLSGSDDRRFREIRTREGMSTTTIQKELGFLRSVAKRLWIDGILSHEDFDRIRADRLPRARTVQPVYLDVDQRKALLDTCRPWLRRIVAWALLTGMDRGEIIALDWSRIPAGLDVLDAPREKTGWHRVIPLTPTLRRILEAAAGGTRPLSGPVFPGERGKRADDKTVNLALARAYVRAGLAPDRVFKGLRHTFRGMAVEAGVPEEIQRALMGHKPKFMTARYGDLTKLHPTLRSALLAIEAVCGHDLDTGAVRSA